MMSGVDEQFYQCPCGGIYGWFIKASRFTMLGWLLDPKSSRCEEKRENGINLLHLYDGMYDVEFDVYVKQIRLFKCRVCESLMKRKEIGFDRLINFIKCNWKERTVRHSGGRY